MPLISRRENIGKQLVYHTLQESFGDISPESITSIDNAIEHMHTELSALKAREKELKAELGSLANVVPLTELRSSVACLEQERRECQERLFRLQGEVNDSAISTSPSELDRMERDWKTWQKHCLVRKKIFFDLWSECTEIAPNNMTKQELQVCNLCSFSLKLRYHSSVGLMFLQYTLGLEGLD
jgi:hypothetical protein